MKPYDWNIAGDFVQPVVRGAEEEVEPEGEAGPLRRGGLPSSVCGVYTDYASSRWCLQPRNHDGPCKLA